jgi:hypothetical protein
VIKKLCKGIEQHIPSKKKLRKYMDSGIAHDYVETTIEKDTTSTSNASITDHEYVQTTTGEYNDDPEQEPSPHLIHEEDWSYISNGQWHPPPDIAPDQLPSINTSKMAPPAQNDSGANQIVTDNKHLLLNMEVIDPIPMGGCNKNDEAAIVCTAVGDIIIQTTDGEHVKFKAYYSADVDGTIISPTAMV